MQKLQKGQRVHILAAASLVVTGVTPYSELKKDSNGNAIHSGNASGGQEVHSLKSSFSKGKDGQQMISLIDPQTGAEFKMSTTNAEVAFAQLLPQLSQINKDAAS